MAAPSYTQALEQLETQQKFIDQVMAAPKHMGTIISHNKEDKTVLISSKGSIVEIGAPDFAIAPGDTVKLVAQGSMVVITSKSKSMDFGRLAKVKSLTAPEPMVEIYSEIGPNVVYCPAKLREKLKPESEVVIDSSGFNIVMVTDRPAGGAERHARTESDVTWDDIGGLDDVKSQMIEIIEKPKMYSSLYKEYGYKPPKGILLLGPPGCGKTMIGKAAVSSIKKVYKGESKFIYIKGPEVLNKYVGATERNIREIFQTAREHLEKTGVPSIIFIDEADALLSRRGARSVAGMETTVVPSFLAEMDGLDGNGALVLLATNRPEQLDPAVVRDGRIDRKIKVNRPDREISTQIAKLNLKSRTSDPKNFELITSEIFSDKRVLGQASLANGKEVTVTLGDAVSGAMIANVVERAVSIALARDIDAGAKKATGVSAADIKNSVDMIQREIKNISLSDEIVCVGDKHGSAVKSFQPAV